MVAQRVNQIAPPVHLVRHILEGTRPLGGCLRSHDQPFVARAARAAWARAGASLPVDRPPPGSVGSGGRSAASAAGSGPSIGESRADLTSLAFG
jgi:hypothetical protein